MDLDITPAIERATAKKTVLAGLSRLPKTAWRDLMVEILVEQGVFTNGAPAPGAVPGATAPGQSAGRPAPPPSPGPAYSGTKTDHIIEVLTQTPRMPVADLALIVYGANDAVAIKRVTALLVGLKRQGRAKTPQRGQWEVIP